jgi:serine carboxypeptidase-like clade 1
MTKGGLHHVAATLNGQLAEIEDLTERRARAEHLYQDVVLNGAMISPKKGVAAPYPKQCTLALRKFLMSSSRALSQSWNDLYIDDYSLFAPVSNLEDEQMAAYMSRADVRHALHVGDAPAKSWPYADDIGFDYTKEYDACNDDDVIVPKISMIDIYQEIVPKLDCTWIYNGDTNPCVSYEGTRLAVKQIGIDEVDGGSYRPWFYNQTAASVEILRNKAPLFGPNLLAQDMGAQFGGEVTDYEQGLAFVTFHGCKYGLNS